MKLCWGRTMRWGALALSVAAAVWMALPGGASAQQSGAGQVTVLTGSATITRAGQARPAKVGAWLMTGDIVQTGQESRLKILFTDNSLVTLGPGTKFSITKQEVSPRTRSRTTSFRVWEGRIRTVVSSWFGETQSFEVRTPTAVAGVRGTTFLVDANDQESTIATTDGTVDADSDDDKKCEPLEVEEGKYTIVRRDTCPSPPADMTDAMKAWDLELYVEPSPPTGPPGPPGDLPEPPDVPGGPPPGGGDRPGGSGVFQGPNPGGGTAPPIGPPDMNPLTDVTIIVGGGPQSPPP